MGLNTLMMTRIVAKDLKPILPVHSCSFELRRFVADRLPRQRNHRIIGNRFNIATNGLPMDSKGTRDLRGWPISLPTKVSTGHTSQPVILALSRCLVGPGGTLQGRHCRSKNWPRELRMLTCPVEP